MELTNLVANFVVRPISLWDNELASQLVNNLRDKFTDAYSLTKCILKNDTAREKTITLINGIDSIVVVLPSEELNFFFDNHGLEPLSVGDSFIDAVTQVQQAVAIFDLIPSIKIFITQIVKSIVILKADDPETDISYSHPDVPFSIFVSVCEKSSPQTDLRIAESILHESMHLMLTLIEGVVPMVNQGSRETYYSPWRDEARPVQGVIHGLFVFKAILEFYKVIQENNENNMVSEFINNRIRTIKHEIKMLSGFPNSPGLTLHGQKLATNLVYEN